MRARRSSFATFDELLLVGLGAGGGRGKEAAGMGARERPIPGGGGSAEFAAEGGGPAIPGGGPK